MAGSRSSRRPSRQRAQTCAYRAPQEIRDVDYETRRGYRLYSTSGLHVAGEGTSVTSLSRAEPFFTLDRAACERDAFYPARAVEIGVTGFLRDRAAVLDLSAAGQQERLMAHGYNAPEGNGKGECLVKGSKWSMIIALVALLAAGVASRGASAADGGPAGERPNSIDLEDVTATAVVGQPGQIEVWWATNSELNTAGFFVMRSTMIDGSYESVNADLILSKGDNVSGATYSIVDVGLDGGVTYYYYIQEVTDIGGTNDHTELTASARPWYGLYLPLILSP